LLTLPNIVLDLVRDGELSAGHARALVPAEDPVKLSQQIVKGGLSVRATEALVKKEAAGGLVKVSGGAKKTSPEKDADTKALEGDLSASLGMKVRLDHKPGREDGQLTVSYGSLDELDELCRILSSR
jgi:ParB family chromosome partitioning protein